MRSIADVILELEAKGAGALAYELLAFVAADNQKRDDELWSKVNAPKKPKAHPAACSTDAAAGYGCATQED